MQSPTLSVSVKALPHCTDSIKLVTNLYQVALRIIFDNTYSSFNEMSGFEVLGLSLMEGGDVLVPSCTETLLRGDVSQITDLTHLGGRFSESQLSAGGGGEIGLRCWRQAFMCPICNSGAGCRTLSARSIGIVNKKIFNY